MIYTKVTNERIVHTAYQITKDETLKEFIESIPGYIEQGDLVHLAINEERMILYRDLYPEQGFLVGKRDSEVSNENFIMLLEYAFSKRRLPIDYIKYN